MSLLNESQDTERKLLEELRSLRREQRALPGRLKAPPELTPGQKVADVVTAIIGSWPFIVFQTGLLAVWIILNLIAATRHWDPYPFILLNLALSFESAYAAPIIMMSQNRQQDIDRRAAENDHRINIKAELEIELLHQKIDTLREKEIALLTQTVADLTELLKRNGLGRAEH